MSTGRNRERPELALTYANRHAEKIRWLSRGGMSRRELIRIYGEHAVQLALGEQTP